MHFTDSNNEEARQRVRDLTASGIPTFSMVSREVDKVPVLASASTPSFIPKYARRIALNILKIYEGVNPADLPVRIEEPARDFVLDMSVAKDLGVYPSFDLMNEARFVGLNESKSGASAISLQGAVLEALDRNLQYNAGIFSVDIAEQNKKRAYADLMPQLSAQVSTAVIDQNISLADGSQLRPGTHSVAADVTQVIFSEPLLANIAIQDILHKQSIQQQRDLSLDIILNTSLSYINLLQIQNILNIRNENVAVTRQNLHTAQEKYENGFIGRSDVYRLESQLAQNNIDLNDILAQYDQARYQFNVLLNRDQASLLDLAALPFDAENFVIAGDQINGLINNQYELELLTDFYIAHALENVPAIIQTDYAVTIAERRLKSTRRSFYLPQIALSGNYTEPLGTYNVPQGVELDATWSIGASASLPIFQGGKRSRDRQINRLELEQLRTDRSFLKQNVELGVRADMETLVASYIRRDLSRISADNAQENFKIIQDLYRQGQADIITLIDAQNNSLQAELTAVNALYQLMADYLQLERDIGAFYFTMTPAEKSSFISSLVTSILNKK